MHNNVLMDVETQLALPFMASDKLIFTCVASVFSSSAVFLVGNNGNAMMTV